MSTDRAPLAKPDEPLPYTAERSHSLAFGSVLIEVKPAMDGASLAAESVREEMIHVDGPVWAVSFHRAWIPFMELNGGDRTWYIDCAPAPGGVSGQVIEVDPECMQWSVRAASFGAFLEGYVADLESGAYPDRDPEGLPTRG